MFFPKWSHISVHRYSMRRFSSGHLINCAQTQTYNRFQWWISFGFQSVCILPLHVSIRLLFIVIAFLQQAPRWTLPLKTLRIKKNIRFLSTIFAVTNSTQAIFSPQINRHTGTSYVCTKKNWWKAEFTPNVNAWKGFIFSNEYSHQASASAAESTLA